MKKTISIITLITFVHRNYNLHFAGKIGNIFHTKDIEAAIEKGRKHLPDSGNSYSQKSVGLDPGFGSSNFGVCITELVDGLIHVLHAEEYQRPDFNKMIDITVNLLDEYSITFEGRSRIFVDGANPSFIRALKERLDEDTDYQRISSFLKKQYPSVFDLRFLEENMMIIPVPF